MTELVIKGRKLSKGSKYYTFRSLTKKLWRHQKSSNVGLHLTIELTMNEYSTSFSKASRHLKSVVELLCFRSSTQPNRDAFTFLLDGETEQATLTYQELDRRARRVAAQLQALGLEGERALLLYPAGLDFLVAFFGCLYASVVAVTAYPP